MSIMPSNPFNTGILISLYAFPSIMEWGMKALCVVRSSRRIPRIGRMIQAAAIDSILRNFCIFARLLVMQSIYTKTYDYYRDNFSVTGCVRNVTRRDI